MKKVKEIVSDWVDNFFATGHVAEIAIAIVAIAAILAAFMGDLMLIARIGLIIVGLAGVVLALVIYVIKRAIDIIIDAAVKAMARTCLSPLALFCVAIGSIDKPAAATDLR